MSSICTGGKGMILGSQDGGIFLPLVTITPDQKPPQWGPAILYLMALLWCFLGVGIISDIFMCAIEKITSAKKQIKIKHGDKEQLRTVKVWNDTVANLTLMALGSSAPEILLSLIELTISETWHSGALGPSTIVGSAAFNLLIITAVCISALPEGEERKIKDLSVFSITATFSIFAYLWLIVILMLITPDVVDVWEGVLTLFFLPLLVGLAYLADIGYFHRLRGQVKSQNLVFSPQDNTKEDFDLMFAILKKKYPRVPEDPAKLEALMYYEFPKTPSRAQRRNEATRGMTGKSQGRRDDHMSLGEDIAQELNPGSKGRNGGWVQPVDDNGDPTTHKPKPVFEHSSPMYAVSESAKKVTLTVKRSGNTEDPCSCRYRTMEGTAKADEDFRKADGKLDFKTGETEQSFEIEILEDKKHESTEEFYVELIPVPNSGILGFTKIATVVVLDSDAPGLLRFEKGDQMSVPEPMSEKCTVQISVNRIKGATGDVKCTYRTEDNSAKAGKDYEECSGDLHFTNGQLEAKIEVGIMPVQTIDKRRETFRLILEPAEEGGNGIGFDEETDGGAESCILTIAIESDTDGEKRYNACMAAAAQREWVNWDNMAIGREHWKEQFVEALYVNGSKEEQAEAGPVDWFFHIISIPWKFFFAVVPPTDFCGGWICFFSALGMIGICTALIGDLANMLGCALNMKPSICAITFVALGTSLPDTFASKQAAIQDPIADNSIGNVTGSNSVNVFLGLGLSWALGAIYWQINGAKPGDSWHERALTHDWPTKIVREYGSKGAFVVPAGNLGPSVGVFCGCAMTCIVVLMCRRVFLGAELGGNPMMSRLSSLFLITLWFVYIVMSVVIEGGMSAS